MKPLKVELFTPSVSATVGSKFNSEFKLWSCETWTCLQTIGFNPNDGDKAVLKASLDLTGKFLVLSDIHRKNVYVFQLQLVRLEEQFTVMPSSQSITLFRRTTR